MPHNFTSKKVFLEKSLFFGNAQVPTSKKGGPSSSQDVFPQENGFGSDESM